MKSHDDPFSPASAPIQSHVPTRVLHPPLNLNHIRSSSTPTKPAPSPTEDLHLPKIKHDTEITRERLHALVALRFKAGAHELEQASNLLANMKFPETQLTRWSYCLDVLHLRWKGLATIGLDSQAITVVDTDTLEDSMLFAYQAHELAFEIMRTIKQTNPPVVTASHHDFWLAMWEYRRLQYDVLAERVRIAERMLFTPQELEAQAERADLSTLSV